MHIVSYWSDAVLEGNNNHQNSYDLEKLTLMLLLMNILYIIRLFMT